MARIQPSDEMTTALTEAMGETLTIMRLVRPFSNGDVMSAALHLLVDAGMVAVEDGHKSREQLVTDICAAVTKAVSLHGLEGGTVQ